MNVHVFKTTSKMFLCVLISQEVNPSASDEEEGQSFDDFMAYMSDSQRQRRCLVRAV